MRYVVAWVGLLGVMTANGSGDPRHVAVTQSSFKPPIAAAMPESFKPLVTRNIFTRNYGKTSASGGVAKISGSGLALRGVIRDEMGMYTAIVEDPATHQIQKIENGASSAGGNISHITLRGFQYEIGGKRIEVAIGQNLAGETATIAPPVPAAMAAGANGEKGPATAPADGADDSSDNAAVMAELANLPEAARAEAIARMSANRHGHPIGHN